MELRRVGGGLGRRREWGGFVEAASVNDQSTLFAGVMEIKKGDANPSPFHFRHELEIAYSSAT